MRAGLFIPRGRRCGPSWGAPGRAAKRWLGGHLLKTLDTGNSGKESCPQVGCALWKADSRYKLPSGRHGGRDVGCAAGRATLRCAAMRRAGGASPDRQPLDAHALRLHLCLHCLDVSSLLLLLRPWGPSTAGARRARGAGGRGAASRQVGSAAGLSNSSRTASQPAGGGASASLAVPAAARDQAGAADAAGEAAGLVRRRVGGCRERAGAGGGREQRRWEVHACQRREAAKTARGPRDQGLPSPRGEPSACPAPGLPHKAH